jgi:hypothetical protein
MTFDEMEQEALVPKELREQGWVYRDVPGRFSFEMWDLFLSVLGEGNYHIIAMSENKEKDWKRGQFLLSPQAMENIAQYTKQS